MQHDTLTFVHEQMMTMQNCDLQGDTITVLAMRIYCYTLKRQKKIRIFFLQKKKMTQDKMCFFLSVTRRHRL